MLSALAITVPETAVSPITTVVMGDIALSARGVECAFAAAFARLVPSGASSSRRKYPVPTTTTKAATPIPFQIWGPIGARSGFVPHHLHSPRLSG